MSKKAELQQKRESKSLEKSLQIHRGQTLSFRLDTYRIGSHTKTFEIVEHPGASVILAIDAAGQILLVRQWRRAVGKILLELPAGTLDPNEDPLSCAERELREETGFRANAIEPLLGFYPAPGFCTEYLHLFLARDLVLDPLPPDADEQIDVISVPLDKALEMIGQKMICDAKSIAGILYFALWRKKTP